MGKLYPGPLRGTWTPVLTFATPGDLNAVFSAQVGEWYMENGLVRLFFFLSTSTFIHTTASGNARITGIPFSAKTLTGMVWGGMLSQMTGVTKASYTQFSCNAPSATTFLALHASGSGQTVAAIAVADLPTGVNKTLTGAITYPIA